MSDAFGTAGSAARAEYRLVIESPIKPGTRTMFSYSKQTLKAVDLDLWAVIQREHQPAIARAEVAELTRAFPVYG